MKKDRKIIAIVGPTASGKTGIGVKLAKELGGEIISADSRQVYRGLDLGTGKDLAEYDGVKYHLIDICDPGERFTLFDYLLLARAVIEDIFSRGKVPIIVGGTGLYVQALTEGFRLEPITNYPARHVSPQGVTGRQLQISKKIPNIKSQKGVIPTPQHCLRVEESSNKRSLHDGRDDNNIVQHDKISRDQLEDLTSEQLQKILKKLDIETYKTIDINNPHRLIRAIERAQEGNIPTKSKPDFEVLQIGITWPNEVLYSRIDKRVEERFEQGMLNEVVGLLNDGVNQDWLLGLGLEYKIITNFVISNFQFLISKKISNAQMTNDQINGKWQMANDNCESFEQMKEILKLRIRQFSKRQMTWFRRFPEIVWENDYNKISKIAKKFLK